MVIDRRTDPRTSKPHSLHNFLRTRTHRDGLILAVVGTRDGFVMGSSRDRLDRQAERLAAHASVELFGRDGRPWLVRETPAQPEVRLLAMRIEAPQGPAFIAALVPRTTAFSLDELASCAKRILKEQVVAA